MDEKNKLVITRVFDAPLKLVFKAWSEAERLAQWWGPKDCKITVSEFDLRPGGVFHYCVSMPNGNEMWGKFIYREIVAPERIVFINSFSDKDGNITRAPFLNTWPLEVLDTMTLTEENGKTALRFVGNPINATEEEHKSFEEMQKTMQEGFGGIFDQLDAYLKNKN